MNSELENNMISTIEQHLRIKYGSELFSNSDAVNVAFEVVEDEIDSHVVEEKAKEAKKIVHKISRDLRTIVARQVVGITYDDAINSVIAARKHFLLSSELTIYPRPTKAYSGKCEPHDPWNLHCNAGDVKNFIQGKPVKEDDVEIIRDLDRADLLLGFVIMGDVDRQAVTATPFDGYLGEYQGLF